MARNTFYKHSSEDKKKLCINYWFNHIVNYSLQNLYAKSYIWCIRNSNYILFLNVYSFNVVHSLSHLLAYIHKNEYKSERKISLCILFLYNFSTWIFENHIYNIKLIKFIFLFSSVCPLLRISSSTGRAQLVLMPGWAPSQQLN